MEVSGVIQFVPKFLAKQTTLNTNNFLPQVLTICHVELAVGQFIFTKAEVRLPLRPLRILWISQSAFIFLALGGCIELRVDG